MHYVLSCKCDAQATPEACKQSTESRSLNSTTQQQQSSQQAQPASWSAIAAQAAAKGTGSPPAVSSAPRSQSSGLGKRGSATDLRHEQVHRLPCAASACHCEQQKWQFGVDGCLSSAQCALRCEDIPLVCALLPTQALLDGRSQGVFCLQGHRSVLKPYQQPQGIPAPRSTSGQALDRAANTSSPAPTVQLRSAGAQLLHRSQPCCIQGCAPSDELDSLK